MFTSYTSYTSKEYYFKLASNKVPKLTCQFCGSKKHWQRYIDTRTGEVLPPEYGLCDNRLKCGQGLNPYSDGFICSKNDQNRVEASKRKEEEIVPYFVPYEVLEATLRGYEENTFIQYLLEKPKFPFEVEDIEQVISLYHLGTITQGLMKGALTIPFIDLEGNIRTIQVKSFDKDNHTLNTNKIDKLLLKDSKEVPHWIKDYVNYCDKVGYYTCCFGEYLLKRFPLNPVILVEAPKTCIYGTLSFGFPDNPRNPLWLSVFNLNGLTYNRCKSLQGREVFLIPDLSKDGSAFRLWKERSEVLSEQLGTRFEVLDFLESLGNQELREQGSDLADIIIRLDWHQLRLNPVILRTEPSEVVESVPSEQNVGQEKTFFSDKEELIEWRVKKIEYLINSFWYCVNKYKPKDLEKYLFCWSRDLEVMINENGLTRQEFVEFAMMEKTL